MIDERMILFQSLVDSLLTTPGATLTSLRAALVQEAARNSTAREGTSIPADLETYVEKVALHAYRVTDQDVEQLRTSGYSEDAIFEITLSVALGAGINCLTQGLAAINDIQEIRERPGEDNAPEEH